jgi:hypothetical protein
MMEVSTTSLTNKVPERLRKAIKEGKKILVLINPPYAEAEKSLIIDQLVEEDEKTTIELLIRCKNTCLSHGFAKRELFVQFLVRIQTWNTKCNIGNIFSTLKYINASNFEDFRKTWDSDYKGGFIVHSKAFDG